MNCVCDDRATIIKKATRNKKKHTPRYIQAEQKKKDTRAKIIS